MQSCVELEKKELNERTQKEVKMLVPETQKQPKYVVSMFLATAGVGGHLQGSDEKEIIYLVFGIVDLQNKEVSDQKSAPKRKKSKTVRVPLEKEIPEKHVFGQSSECVE